MLTKEQKEKFNAWWSNSNTGRPLVNITGIKDASKNTYKTFDSPKDMYCNWEKKVYNYKEFIKNTEFFMEAFPHLTLDLGAGSLALYLGSEPIFSYDTVWFKELATKSMTDLPKFKYNPDNYWLNFHTNMLKKAVEESERLFCIAMPDIIENIDILSALRGTQNTCFDIYDNPELVKEKITELDSIYFKYFDDFYNIIKLDDNSSVYTAYDIWGPGKTAKIQCDFCAMMSPLQFKEFIIPSLEYQCNNLDNAMFHLDGKEAAVHLEALMEIKNLKALQWTPSNGIPDCFDDCWIEPIYDKVYNANKALHLHSVCLSVEKVKAGVSKLTERYGTKGMYYNIMGAYSVKEAEEIANFFETSF